MADNWPVGAPIEDLDTPALILDIDVAQRNIDKMADFFADKPCTLRPHFKNHKCTTLMKRQLVREAVGVTCAKLGEAEVCVEAGITDVLIANQVVGERKIRRLLDLLPKAIVRVAVDDPGNVRELSELASQAGQTIGCLIEVEIGMKRCGVRHSVLMEDDDERNSVTRESIGDLVGTRRFIEDAGLPVAIVSGGGAGTYDLTGTIPGMDELQAGTYVTMDWRYQKTRPEFELALSVMTTCISAQEPNRGVLDVGVKGVGAEFGPPIVRDRPDISP